MIDTIDGLIFKDMVINGSTMLQNDKEEINELNVFPVPDGDTGTNMSLTISAAVTELKKGSPQTVCKAAEITASALLRGARGNSGVILSLIFRGFAKSVKDKDTIDSIDFANALCGGVEAAYSAVMKPAEGTILTVSRLSSNAAKDIAMDEADILTVLEHAISVGYEALANTINQNPVLKKAGVVDAGGKGYLLILVGMHLALKGETVTLNKDEASAPKQRAEFSDFETEDINFTYCTEFIVERENGKEPFLLKGFLDKLGDSIVVVDDDEIIKVHVHTNDPGIVLTEALTYGSFATVKIENMKLQHTHNVDKEQNQNEEQKKSAEEPESKYGIVVVSAGEGLSSLFRDLGANAIITGGQTMNPSTDDILKAIESVSAKNVYVFPNNKNIIMAAEQCIELTDRKVIIIPTKSIPQGISALLSFDPIAEEAINTQSMNEAITNVKTAQITYAARNSEFDGMSISQGEYLTLIDNTLVGNYTDLDTLLDNTAGVIEGYDPQFVTVIYGEDVTEDQANGFAETLTRRLPDAEISVIFGGQPVYYYMISIE